MSDDLLHATLDLLRDLVAVEQVAVHDRELTAAVERLAKLRITIPMAPGTESLNVAAAAAICLYETFRR